MAVKYTRFFLVKLILVLFASVGGFLVAFLLSLTLPESADASLRALLTGVVPTAVFFAFIYSFQSKIRVPDDVSLSARYFLKFTLRETSVYAVFALIPNIIASIPGTQGGSFLGSLILPHTALAANGVHVILNYIIYVALYAAVSFAAHYIRTKKPLTEPNRSASESVPADIDDGIDEADDISEDDENDADNDNDERTGEDTD